MSELSLSCEYHVPSTMEIRKKSKSRRAITQGKMQTILITGQLVRSDKRWKVVGGRVKREITGR